MANESVRAEINTLLDGFSDAALEQLLQLLKGLAAADDGVSTEIS